MLWRRGRSGPTAQAELRRRLPVTLLRYKLRPSGFASPVSEAGGMV